MTMQKCCLTLGWDTIGWDNISPDVQILGIDLSPVGENISPDVQILGIDLSPVGETWYLWPGTIHVEGENCDVSLSMKCCYVLIW